MILLLLLLTLPALGQLTDNFAGGNACLNNLSGKGWDGVNFGSGDDCIKRTAGGLFEITDTRTSTNTASVWNRGPLLTDHYAQLKINNPGGSGTSTYCMGVALRATKNSATTWTGYAVYHCRSGTTSTFRIYRVDAGAHTQLGVDITSYTPQVNDDLMKASIVGSTITWEILRGSSVIASDTRSDANITSGRCGVVGSTGSANLVRNVIFDDFTCDDATPGVSATKSYYVSASGNDKADGTTTDPLSITQAFLAFDGLLKPGNRVWLRSGTYTSPTTTWTLASAGSLGKPIMFRNYPGELPKFDGVGNTVGNGANVLNITGAYTWLWGGDWFSSLVATEAQRSWTGTNSGNTNLPTGPTFSSTATGSAIINSIIRDDGGAGITNAPDSYWYGNVGWANGGANGVGGQAKGQVVYAEGTGGARQRYMNNIIFNTFDSGMQLQGSGSGGVKNMNMILAENAFVQGGMFQSVADGAYLHGLLIGANARCGNNILRNNSIWNPESATRGNGLAWFTNACLDVDSQNNHIVTDPTVSTSDGANRVTFITHSGNKYYGGGIDSDTNTAIAGNTHSVARSTSATPDIYYYKNLFSQPGGNVHVFTHDGAATEDIDPSQLGFVSGDPLRIRTAFNPLGASLSETIYGGGTVSVTTNLANGDVAQPVGWTPRSPVSPNQDGNSRFSAFILDRTPTVRTVTRQFHDGGTGAAKIRVKYGTSNDTVTIDARPIEVTVKRNNTTISTVSAAATAVVTLTRPAPFPVNSKTMLMFNIADSCWRTALSKAHTIGTGANAPLANQFTPTPTVDTSGCSAWAEAAPKLLFSPNPIDLYYTGSPLFTNDTVVLADGTSRWGDTNGTHTITSGDDGLMGLPTVNLTPIAANTFTSTGTAFVSTAHGLSVNDFVWAIGATSTNQIRKVTAVADADNATLDAAFSSDVTSEQWRRIEADFEVMTGTVPSAKVNRNPLTFDIRSGYFDPATGTAPTVTISGPTDSCWKGAIGTWTATLVVNGRFTIPFDASGCGTSVGQTFTITTPRALDAYPEVEATFTSNRATVSIPIYIGKSWFQTELVNSAGTVIARSDRQPLTAN